MVSVVIPVYNEEKILKDSVKKLGDFLEQRKLAFEVIVVDNGSVDQTEQIGRDLQTQIPWFRYFRIPERSVGKAFALGVREAKYNHIVSMDADLSVELIFIDRAHSLLKDSEMVVGSKVLGSKKRSLVRVVGSQTYLAVTQILFQMAITDFSMGAKAYKRDLIRPILDEIDTWTAYVFEICVWLIHNKKSIVQVSVECVDLRKSRFNIWHEGFYRYWNLFRVWREYKDPQSWFQRIRPQ